MDTENSRPIGESALRARPRRPGALHFLPCDAPTTGTEAATLAAERDQLFGVTGFAMYPQKALFKATTFEVFLKLPLHISGQGFVLGCHLGPKCRVVP
ncbi:MAG: hypothetical protein ACI9HY_004443, partial [Planctomycetaceae bacterium]